MAIPSSFAYLISVIVFITIASSSINCAAIPVDAPETKEPLPPLDRAPRSIDMPQKRPFCNAFTGCGRKRSGLNTEQMPRENSPLRDLYNSIENESANNIFDFNSEPAVADIMQQIMSEAKVWDAIQAANRELKKQAALNHNQNFPSFSAQ